VLVGGSSAELTASLAVMNASTAALLQTILSPTLAFFNLALVIRIVMTWYPDIPGNKFPWAIAYFPTEPVLAPVRFVITPVGGVDVSPIAVLFLTSFINEILLGQQGILQMLQK